MSKVFAWIMLAISAITIFLQVAVADATNVLVTLLWSLVAVLCLYVLFFKKKKRSKASE